MVLGFFLFEALGVRILHLQELIGVRLFVYLYRKTALKGYLYKLFYIHEAEIDV